jgi:hypothetical protein
LNLMTICMNFSEGGRKTCNEKTIKQFKLWLERGIRVVPKCTKSVLSIC